MWQIAHFYPTTFFSLRPANATTSGGKTLVTPTPFAVKMALLDAAIRVHGRSMGERWFPRIRDIQVAIRLPPNFVVINTFIKILRPHKAGSKDVFGTGLEGPMGNTIAYRELVHYGDALWLAVRDEGFKGGTPPFASLLTQIHYLGKRGGFMQFVSQSEAETLLPQFTILNPEPGTGFPINGLLQVLDDCGPKMKFAQADVFSNASISIGKENGRLLNPVVLPYHPIRSSRAFTLYEYQAEN